MGDEERDQKIVENAERREKFMTERRRGASAQYLKAIHDLLELVREEVTGVIAAHQVKTLERLIALEKRIEELEKEQ